MGDGPENGDGAADRQQGSGGGSVADMDEGELHAVVRDAVEDAVLGVIGTLLLVGIGLVLAWAGGAALFRSTGSLALRLGRYCSSADSPWQRRR